MFKLVKIPDDPALSVEETRRRQLRTVRPVATKHYEPVAPSADLAPSSWDAPAVRDAKFQKELPPEQPTDKVLGENVVYKKWAAYPALVTSHGYALDPVIFPWLTDRAAAYTAYSIITVRAFDVEALRDEDKFREAVHNEYKLITAYDVRDVGIAARHSQHLQREIELRGWPTRQNQPMVLYAAYSTGPEPKSDGVLSRGNRIALREILRGVKPSSRAQEQAHLRAKRRYESTTPEEQQTMMTAAIQAALEPSVMSVMNVQKSSANTDALWSAFSFHEARLQRLEAALESRPHTPSDGEIEG